METTLTATRSTSVNADDIITVLRLATQNQYNARELHTTVR